MLEREPAVPGDVVGMRVGLERADDSHVEPLGLPQDGLDRERRVDHDRLARLLAADEVRRAAEIVVHELREAARRRTLATDAAIEVEVSASQTSEHEEAPDQHGEPDRACDERASQPLRRLVRGGRRDDGQPRRPAHDGAVVVALAGTEDLRPRRGHARSRAAGTRRCRPPRSSRRSSGRSCPRGRGSSPPEQALRRARHRAAPRARARSSRAARARSASRRRAASTHPARRRAGRS